MLRHKKQQLAIRVDHGALAVAIGEGPRRAGTRSSASGSSSRCHRDMASRLQTPATPDQAQVARWRTIQVDHGALAGGLGEPPE